MKPGNKNRIPNWLIIYFICINSALLFLGIWFFKFEKNTQHRKVEIRLLDIAQLKASQISEWRKERIADATILMERQALTNSIEKYLTDHNEREVPEIVRRLTLFKDLYDYSEILVVNHNNKEILNIGGEGYKHTAFISVLDSAFLHHKPAWTELHPGNVSSLPHLALATPLYSIRNANQRLGGIILICDAQRFLFPLIESWPVSSKTAETLLIRKDGDDVLFLNELRHRKDTALKLRIPVTQTDLPAAMAVSGKIGIVHGKDYRNIKVIAAILPIPESPWFIVSKMDESEAFSEWHFRAFLILLLMIGSVSFVMLTGFLIWQRNLKIQYRKLYQSETDLRISMEKHSVTLSAIGDAVISTDAKGLLELMNPVAEKLTGWTMDEARGLPLSKVFHIINEETREPVENPVARVLKEGTVIGLANHTLLIDKQGNETAIADSGAPIRDEAGEMAGVVLVFRDQNEERLNQKLIEMRLTFFDYAIGHSIREFMIRALDQIEKFMGSTFAAFCFLDTDHRDPVKQFWSSNLAPKISGDQLLTDMMGESGFWRDCAIEKRTLIKNHIMDFDTKTEALRKQIGINRLLAVPIMRSNKAVSVCCICNKSKDYTEKDAEILSYFADLIWEIAEQKQTTEALIKSEALLNATGKLARIGGWEHNFTTRKAVWTQALYDIFEIPYHQEPPGPDHYLDYCPEHSRQIMFKTMNQSISEKAPFNIEIQFFTATRKLIWCHILGEPVLKNGQCTGMHGTLQDITEKKLAEEAFVESQRKLSTLMSNLPGMAYRCRMDTEWTMEFVSDGCEELTGYKPRELIDNASISYADVIHPDDRRMVRDAVEEGVNQQEPFQMTYRIHTADGKEKWVWEQGRGIFRLNDGLIAIEGFIIDTTGKKTAEDQLQKSLKEKELLLRELYHRTKNNMQVISSLLHLKANRIEDSHFQSILQEMENKIHSMALVHKKLYESNDLSSLNLKNYFQDLIHLIRNSYTIDEKQIAFVYEAVDTIVLIDTAVPLGLVLNELLTNAVKYAFPGGKRGIIDIKLSKKEGEGLIIEVADNGVGLPPSFDMRKNMNLGLETVMDLITKQLRSEISYENHKGLKYRIVIKEELYEPRI